MQRARHAEPSTAALAGSSFWVGMSLGRFILGPLTDFLGPGPAVLAYVVGTIFLQVLLKNTSSHPASIMLLAANGVFCGPLFPSGIVLLAQKVLAGSNLRAIAAAAAIGQLGAGIVPLAVGIVTDSLGNAAVLDTVLLLSGWMLVVWLGFWRMREQGS